MTVNPTPPLSQTQRVVPEERAPGSPRGRGRGEEEEGGECRPICDAFGREGGREERKKTEGA